jgi:hypothetical protein
MGEKVVEMCEICVNLGEMVTKWRQIQEAGKAWKAGKAGKCGDWWEIGGKVGKVGKCGKRGDGGFVFTLNAGFIETFKFLCGVTRAAHAQRSEARGDDGRDGRAAVGADGAVVGRGSHVGIDVVAAEAVAAREDAQGVDLLVLEADGAREGALDVGLLSALGVVLGGEGLETGLDDGVLFGAFVVGLGVELVDLRLEGVDLIVLGDGVATSHGTQRGAGGAAGRVAHAVAGALGHDAIGGHANKVHRAMVKRALGARS